MLTPWQAEDLEKRPPVTLGVTGGQVLREMGSTSRRGEGFAWPVFVQTCGVLAV